MQSISASLKAMRSRARRFRSAIHQDERHWRHVANFKPWITYHLSEQPLTDLQRLLLDSLRRDGIAITTVEDILGHKMLSKSWEKQSGL